MKLIEKMKHKKARYSIKIEFAIYFIGLVAGTILLCIFVNNRFLPRYYLQNKEHALLNAFDTVNTASESGDITSDEFDIELRKICGKYNISILVMDSNSEAIKAAGNDEKNLRMQLLDVLFGRALQKNNKRVLAESDQYELSIRKDPRTQTESIEMWGVLDNGNTFFMQSALESITESAAIANRFLAYTGCIAILASAVLIWFVSRKITEPVLALAKISERMTNLDFDAKYTSHEHNEIGMLGENINKLSATLESTISELKTANNELQQDIEKKEKIDEMRKEFLSNVSHELKTPIALIQGYAEGLADCVNDDEESRRFYCDVIMDEAGKMNIMVKKLLTLNQLEFGNDPVAIERFDISALVKNYLSSADILVKQNEVKLRFEEYPPIFVWGDEFKIEEVVMNYFSNALNHAQGEKIIEVKLIQRDKKVRVSIFNTGEPIPEESLPHLWEKFYKVDKARTRAYGGSGVGLSIVKAIMESHHQQFGAVNYENGVEFWFELLTE
ncbi:MAG: HAMP domain-containing sensor histidine kinase [Lachnospiraceae bacterium]|nr:HAMP domain-containing sensor histidine kinase [Lachnospiraceae bacterium]